MFDLKKKQPSPRERFMFDLELEIREHPATGKKLLEKASNHMQEIKKALREGVNEKDFDQLGVLLHGYTALQKVLKKVNV